MIELRDLAVRIATDASRLLIDGLGEQRLRVDTKSSATDMVTEIDRASEALIVRAILDARPDDGILGEEGTDRAGTSGVRWIVDPLDGTTNYLYGHAGFAVSIGVEHDGVPVAAVVVDPLQGQTFAAARGEGATRNGIPIQVSGVRVLSDALVATGFAYDPDRRHRQAEVLTHVLHRVRDIRRMGAAAVDLCSVACGRVDAYYERGLAPWDFSAGALIAAEAGAVVRADGFHFAASPLVANELHRLLIDAGAALA